MSTPPKLADFILEFCQSSPSDQIDPEDVAKAFFAKIATNVNIVRWEGYLIPVRENAVKLAREGKIVIYRKGVPADPDTFKGVYRLGLAIGADRAAEA